MPRTLTAGTLVLAASLTALAAPAQQAPAAGPPAPDAALLARALRLHAQVPLVDGHNDLPWEIREKGGSDPIRMSPEGPLPGQMTDVPRLRQGGVGGVFWAAYVPVEFEGHGAARVAMEQIDLIHRMTEASPSLDLALTAADVRRIHGQHRIASLIGIEGGHAIESSLGTLRQFYALGVRYMTLTHVNTLPWADAATDSARHGGLTPFGEEVVREMNRLGMLVDLSHVSAETMRDALRVSRAPVIFSHSSARAVADHPRNVPDDVLELVKANGGIVMTNFYSGFVDPQAAAIMRDMVGVERRLRAEHPGNQALADSLFDQWRAAHPIPRGTVQTVADHVDHLVRVAGIDHVGIGSDFDGISTTPVGLEDVSKFPNLTAELLRRGYSDGDVKKILGLNLLRVMERAEQVSARLRRERPASTRTIEEMDGPAKP
ncbi:MAG: Membrane dipeptidase [Gemmatimonadetes bacterium]|nr:Membrane dipeptidase [Gemmatimonadota bacterium]